MTNFIPNKANRLTRAIAWCRGLVKSPPWQLIGRCSYLVLEIAATCVFLTAFAPIILLMHATSLWHKRFGSAANHVERPDNDCKVIISRNGRVLHILELAPRDEEIERLLIRIANEGLEESGLLDA